MQSPYIFYLISYVIMGCY